MSAQLDIDFSKERARRRDGMQSATEHADREIDGWSGLAFEFLRTFAMTHEFIFAEDVSRAAEAWGLVDPPDSRAWGGIYHGAMARGVIERTERTRRRANGSLAMVYRSLLFKAAA